MKQAVIILCSFFTLVCVISCHREDTPEPTPQEDLNIPLSRIEYAEINWDSPSTIFDEASGILTLSSETAPPRVNSSFVAIESKNNPIRVVQSVKRKSDSYEVVTRDGTMEDLFINTSFTLVTSKDYMADLALENGTSVFLPSLIEFDSSIPSRTDSDLKDLFRFRITKDNLPDYPTSFSIENFLLESSFQLALSFDFGEQIVDNLKKGKINHIEATLYSDLSLSSMYQILGRLMYSPTIPFHSFYFHWTIGSIPIVLSISPGFSITFSNTANIEEIQTHNMVDAQLNGSLGFEWSRNEEISHFTKFNRSFVYDVKSTGKTPISYQQTIWPNVNIPVKLYNLLSFSFGIGPAFVSNYHCFMNNEGYYGWSRHNTAEYRLGLGFDVDLISDISYSLWDYSFTAEQVTLSSFPSQITLLSTSSDSLGEDEISSLTFRINGLKDKEIVPVEGALVKFVAQNGKLSSEFVNSDIDGIATVVFSLDDYTEKGILSAYLIDGKGDIISEVRNIVFSPKEKEGEYVPTDNDHIIRYKRSKSGDEKLDHARHIERYDTGNTLCGLTIVSHEEDYVSDNNSILGTIIFSEPVLAVTESAFMWATIESISLPLACEEIGTGAFSASALTDFLYLPNRIRTIGSNAFVLTNITGVEFGNSLRTIGTFAFSGLPFVSTPMFPSSLRAIEAYAFLNNTMAGEIHLPAGLQTLGAGAFSNCDNILGSVTIPRSVENIGLTVFEGCTKLQSIYVPRELAEKSGSDYFELLYLGVDYEKKDACHATVIYY